MTRARHSQTPLTRSAISREVLRPSQRHQHQHTTTTTSSSKGMRAHRFYRSPNKSSTTLEPSNISLTDTECSSNIPIPNFQNSTLFPCATCFAFFLSFILFFFSFFLFSHLSLSFFLLLVLFPPQRAHFFTHTTETLHCFSFNFFVLFSVA